MLILYTNIPEDFFIYIIRTICLIYPNNISRDKIETFIDENKALIKRMYGSFTIAGGGRVRRAPGVPDVHAGDSYFRHVRQAKPPLPDAQTVNDTGR